MIFSFQKSCLVFYYSRWPPLPFRKRPKYYGNSFRHPSLTISVNYSCELGLWPEAVNQRWKLELWTGREVEGDHTGERISSGVVNLSCASTDHLPEHLSWDAGRKQQGRLHGWGESSKWSHNSHWSSLKVKLQNSATHSSRGKLIYTHPVGQLSVVVVTFCHHKFYLQKNFNEGQKPDLCALYHHTQCIVSASSVNHHYIIRISLGHYQGNINTSSAQL